MKTLAPVIQVIEDKCVNCHKCIDVCPVKICNDGSGNVVKIKSDLCIGCGACIKACTHGARIGIDDADKFFNDCRLNTPIIAVIAPAAFANFPGAVYNLISFLKSIGVKDVFDVSYGAELTVKSYLEYIKDHGLKYTIAQPCPSIVSYIEIYKPKLLKHLIPIDSPLVHTIKMVKLHYPQYKKYKFVFISPCYAKKREMDATGFGDYNVTFKSIAEYLIKIQKNIQSYEPGYFVNFPSERGCLFPMPGGLTKTAERYNPEIGESIRRIEGHDVYEYFESAEAISENKLPNKLVDCLNCKNGCNCGPGSITDMKSLDVIEEETVKRSNSQKTHVTSYSKIHSKRLGLRNFEKTLDSYWDKFTYSRKYEDRSISVRNLKPLTDADFKSISTKMYKTTKSDYLDCGACGYDSCKQMMLAIKNGLNKPENCSHYMHIRILKDHESHKSELSSTIQSIVDSSVEQMNNIVKSVQTLSDNASNTAASVAESSAAIEEMIANIRSINETLTKNEETINLLYKAFTIGLDNVTQTNTLVANIAEESESLTKASSVISDVANRTNILGLNAAIEAAHVGNVGNGFAVVSTEIRKLSTESSDHAKAISKSLCDMKNRIASSTANFQAIRTQLLSINDLLTQVKDQEFHIKNAVQEQSAGGKQVLEALTEINTLSAQVNDEAKGLITLTGGIIENIKKLCES